MTSRSKTLDNRPSLLVVGCGDVGLRVLKLLRGRWRLLALSSSPERFAMLRRWGAQVVAGDLDQPHTLAGLMGVAHAVDAVLHLAPPPSKGLADTRTQALIAVLRRVSGLQTLVYGSTTGVYGDCGGAWLDETRAVNPASERAHRRVHAEQQLRAFGRQSSVAVSILRIPGIYAQDREGGRPRDRLLRGTPVLEQADDVYTNHIHADDLARACVTALYRGAPQRLYNVSDDSELKMGDYFDSAARLEGLPMPPRISRAIAQQQLLPMQLSFMSESRRLRNTRLKRELRLRLRHPTVLDGLRAK